MQKAHKVHCGSRHLSIPLVKSLTPIVQILTHACSCSAHHPYYIWVTVFAIGILKYVVSHCANVLLAESLTQKVISLEHEDRDYRSPSAEASNARGHRTQNGCANIDEERGEAWVGDVFGDKLQQRLQRQLIPPSECALQCRSINQPGCGCHAQKSARLWCVDKCNVTSRSSMSSDSAKVECGEHTLVKHRTWVRGYIKRVVMQFQCEEHCPYKQSRE